MASLVLATVSCGTICLAIGALIRRWQNDRFVRRVKRLCIHYGLTPTVLLQGKYSAQCLARLRALPLCSLELLLEPLLLKCGSAPPLAAALQELCLELGLIDVWQRRVLGQFSPISLHEALALPDGLLYYFSRLHFLVRARSARNLGLLGHQASWPVLAKALEDPHPDVQQVALRSLAVLRKPETLPALLRGMDKAVSGNNSGLSIHSLKAALAKFPFSQALQLMPAVRHPHPQVRAAAVEILLEMAKREPAGAPTLLQSKSVLDRELAVLAAGADPELRDRATELIARLDVAPSPLALRDRLRDSRWFVQAGALQALAGRPGILPLGEFQDFLTDPHRTVRQAALRAIIAYGHEGVSKVYEHFLKTEDKTLRDQLIEEFDRSGLLLSLLQNLGNSPDSLETRVVERLISVGAAHCLQAALTNSSGRELLQVLVEKFEDHCPPKIDAWLELCAAFDAARQSDLLPG